MDSLGKTEENYELTSLRFEVFTAVKIQAEVFWVVTPCSVAVGYQRFGGIVVLRNVDPTAALQSVTTQKTST
jgi:hypothetical protein